MLKLALTRADVLIAIGLVVVTAAAFWQVSGLDFIALDDPAYVTRNPYVVRGLTLESVRYALTGIHGGNRHPLTTLSHMLDCEWFGPGPGPAHRTNLILHIAATLFLYAALRRLTGTRRPAALVAALFAVHPLHVESVAWVSERKDVLSACFWMLTLWLYARYVETRGPARYAAVVTSLALGLLAKPMLVTLPFVLLLLDFWPLGRIDPRSFRRDAKRLVVEKLPLFALAAVSVVATLSVQSVAMSGLNEHGLAARGANAIHSYCMYLVRTVWPVDLAVLYPFDARYYPLVVLAEAALLIGATCFAWWSATRRPWILTGWLWYLGTLVPVLGLVQVGAQARADRYSYLPLIGIFIAVAFTLHEFVARRRVRPVWIAIPVAAVLGGLCAGTVLQVARWKDSLTLFEHAARATGDNAHILTLQAAAWIDRGRPDRAEESAREALRLHAKHVPALGTLGALLAQRGALDEAIATLTEALRLDPANVDANYNLGKALIEAGLPQEALPRLWSALSQNALHTGARDHLALAYGLLGRFDESLSEYRRLVDLAPADAMARRNLAIAAFESGQVDEAVRSTRTALDLAERQGLTALASQLREQVAAYSRAP